MIKKFVFSLAPGLISFGPVFMVIGVTAPMPYPIFGYGGAVGLSLGLFVMFRQIQNQQSELILLKEKLANCCEKDSG